MTVRKCAVCRHTRDEHQVIIHKCVGSHGTCDCEEYIMFKVRYRIVGNPRSFGRIYSSSQLRQPRDKRYFEEV